MPPPAPLPKIFLHAFFFSPPHSKTCCAVPVNSLGSSGNLSAVNAKNKSTFHIELHKFFTKYKRCEIADTRASELNYTTVENAENVVSEITETNTQCRQRKYKNNAIVNTH